MTPEANVSARPQPGVYWFAGDRRWAPPAIVGEPPSYLPPEPVRYVGARTVRAAVKRCEDREERGLQPDPVSRQLRRALGVSMPRRLKLPRALRPPGRSRVD